MKLNFIRKEVKCYIEETIKPLYKTFDKAHNLSHFKFVTDNCIEYGKELINQGMVIDLEIAYLVGALHDVGIYKGRENHAKSSGEFVRNDKKLLDFYDKDTIQLIAEAVEDHSSSIDYEPRNIYGKLVADADRNNTLYLTFARPIKFAIKHESYRDRESHINSVYEFVMKKFGRNGYAKYWLNIPQTTMEKQKIWELLDNEKECKAYIAGIFDEITKGKKK